MSTAAIYPVVRHLTRSADPDPELLRRFVVERDEVAFAMIVRRHGRMVFDVCRGALANHADAEDAFQAVFLTLARKAGSVREAGSLGCWLHGVAYRVTQKLRAATAGLAVATRGVHGEGGYGADVS